MPRQPRFWSPGAVLHVTQRGNNRGAVFAADQDRLRYLAWLEAAATAHGVAIHAYVLMTNHVHLLATPSSAEAMPCMMQALGRRYVGWFNHVHGRTGTLWEGRYRATMVDSENYFLACMRYIELNPVRAAMTADPMEYEWSSHRANAMARQDTLVTPHALYLALGRSVRSRCATYREWCGRGDDAVELAAIRDASRYEWALGSTAFCESVGRHGRRPARLPMGRPSGQSERDADPT